MTKECPYIDRNINPENINRNFNEPKTYKCDDGFEYVFYEHFDGFDTYYNCQFCKLIGRKKDVFECLNESEWKNCSHYVHKSEKN